MDDRPLLHDRYRVVRRLGRGAFATVYLADDLRMDRPVAIKVVEDSIDLDGRALREARAAAKLDHPHIVTVHEVVREEGRTLLFTEYVEGHTLRQLYAKRRLSHREIVQAGIQVARALEHAHKRGVVHRDIKPENIMLVESDDVDVRIMDFGVARLEDQRSITREGDLVGTLAYMAPEQLAGGEAGPRADVYALAVTLYEGLAGENPARGKSLAELLKPGFTPATGRLAESSDLPASLAGALSGALAPEQERRADAHAFRRSLEAALRQMPEPEVKPGLLERAEGGLLGGLRSARSRFVTEHLVSGVLVFLTLALVVFRVPFYPFDARIPLVAAVSFLALLWPFVGGLAAFAAIAAPIFGFGTGWGWLYLLCCLPVYGLLAWRKKAWAAYFPILFVVFGALSASFGPLPAGVGLMLPLLAGMALGWWGAFAGLFGGLGIALAAGFQGWETLPFAFTQGGEAVLAATLGEGSLVAVAKAFARFLDARLELALQAAVLAVLSLPVARLMRSDLAWRLWTAAGYLVALMAALVLLPGLVVGHPAAVGPLVLAFVACAIITFLLAVVLPGRGPAGSSGSGNGSGTED